LILSINKIRIEALEKASSHISGFDEILMGGLPEGRTTLIEGGPGTGKSILAMEKAAKR
jgi:circadian clock protein KaiC